MERLTHHAYVSYMSPARARDMAAVFVKALGIAVAHNPDVHIRTYENLGVDDARELVRLVALRGVGIHKVFIVAAQSLTREAQNALLKTIEEPPAQTYFGFVVPRGALLVTMRSRLVEITFPAPIGARSLAREFLAAQPGARSTLIAKVVEDKEKHTARELIDDLEALLRSDIQKKPVRAALSELSEMRTYLLGPSPSVKMILEHLALVVPTVK